MISLQFCREARLTSDLISWFSAGQLSHVDAILPDGNLLGAFERAVSGYYSGVQIRKPGYIKLAACVRVDVETSVEKSALWEKFLRSQVGDGYDWGAIKGFVTGRYSPRNGEWICSELQVAALQIAGIVRPLYLAPSKITPVALLLALSALPETTIHG